MTTNEQHATSGYKIILSLVGLLSVIFAGSLAGGEIGEVMSASIQVIPFLVLAVLAYLATDRLWAKVVAIGWLLLVIAGFGFFCLLWCILALTDPATAHLFAADSTGIGAAPSAPTLLPNALQTLVVVVIALAFAGLVGMIGFIAPVRREFSRVAIAHFDQQSFVHMLALVATLAVTLMACMPLLVLGDPPILAESAIVLLETTTDDAATLRFQLYAMLWTTVGAFFIVGFGIRRNFRETLDRLGVVLPTRKQLILAIVFTPVLVLGVLGMGEGLDWLWRTMGWQLTNEEALEVVFGSSLSLWGAIISSVAAGVGEELAVRGVLQPRLGIVLSNLFFASMHALQYNWDGVISVFLIGLVFALVRQRTNTTISAIMHTGYDFILFSIVMAEQGIQ
jgi:membrane protease YdiL (CAAX protease family)